jgi:preprotein translocase subunit YajC
MLTNLAISGLTLMAARPAGGEGQQGSWITTLMPLVVIFAIFYFLMIRPQQKQQKKHREMLAAIKKGDRVITRGGMHGTVFGITDNIITIEVTNELKLKFNREAIAGISGNESA